jgi:hypothetical protein
MGYHRGAKDEGREPNQDGPFAAVRLNIYIYIYIHTYIYIYIDR